MDSPVDHSDLVAQFVTIVSCDADKALFYLEANNWDINAALSNFYEEPPMSSALPSTANPPPAPLPAEEELYADQVPTVTGERRRSAAPGPMPGGRLATGGGRTLDGRFEPTATPAAGTHTPAAPWPRTSMGPRVATLGDLSSTAPRGRGPGPDSDDDDGERVLPGHRNPENWFTGGERSGMMVEAPPNSNDNPPVGNAFGIVRDILRKAAGGRSPTSPDEGGPSGVVADAP
ncbi:protein phosphatase regulator, partial [Tieghemiomyces parasiticus]